MKHLYIGAIQTFQGSYDRRQMAGLCLKDSNEEKKEVCLIPDRKNILNLTADSISLWWGGALGGEPYSNSLLAFLVDALSELDSAIHVEGSKSMFSQLLLMLGC